MIRFVSMSNNRKLYRKLFLDSMHQARHYKNYNPDLARGLRVQALGSLDQLRADERGMLMPDHTHMQALQAINFHSLQVWYGNNPFNVIKNPGWVKKEDARGLEK
jgi:hypothetical protein